MILIANDKTNENFCLDIYITEHTDFTRSFVSNNIKDGRVIVNGEVVTKNSYQEKLSDVIFIEDDIIKELDIEPEALYLDIKYDKR